MSETDSVHESFYDLFNQRFRCIEDPKTEPRYFTNIAIGAHSRPCRVNPNFQCVVIVKESEVKQTPAPFLNRFEKYRITHSTLLTTVLAPLPPLLKKLVMAAKEKVCILCGSNDVIVLVLQKARFFIPPALKVQFIIVSGLACMMTQQCFLNCTISIECYCKHHKGPFSWCAAFKSKGCSYVQKLCGGCFNATAHGTLS